MLTTATATALISLLPLQDPAEHPVGTVHPPPRDVAQRVKNPVEFETDYGDELRGVAQFSMERRQVRISWNRTYAGRELPVWTDQVERISFWPTEIAGWADGIVVAGLEPLSGHTVIELWVFGETLALPQPEPDGEGGLHYPPTPKLPVTSRLRVLDQHVPGQHLVRTMWRNHGEVGRLIVQFHDSRDVYGLDTVTGQLQPLFTPDPQGAVPIVPELTRAYTNRLSMEHGEHGYVYFMTGYFPGPEDSPTWEALAFHDADRDGVLESTSLVDSEGWGAFQEALEVW